MPPPRHSWCGQRGCPRFLQARMRYGFRERVNTREPVLLQLGFLYSSGRWQLGGEEIIAAHTDSASLGNRDFERVEGPDGDKVKYEYTVRQIERRVWRIFIELLTSVTTSRHVRSEMVQKFCGFICRTPQNNRTPQDAKVLEMRWRRWPSIRLRRTHPERAFLNAGRRELRTEYEIPVASIIG